MMVQFVESKIPEISFFSALEKNCNIEKHMMLATLFSTRQLITSADATTVMVQTKSHQRYKEAHKFHTIIWQSAPLTVTYMYIIENTHSTEKSIAESPIPVTALQTIRLHSRNNMNVC